MKIVLKLTLVITALVVLSNGVFSQARLDSLLHERENQFNAYNQFKLSLDERPWIKLVELGEKADNLIKTDNLILQQYLNQQINYNADLSNEIEKLNLELALLNKEARVNNILLNERQRLTNTLLFVIGGISVLLIVIFILFIDRQTRFRSARMELERLWAAKGEHGVNKLQQDEWSMLANQVNKLSEENDQLKKELNQEQGQKSEAMESLKKEIRNRRQVEQEIKDLISEIKKK